MPTIIQKHGHCTLFILARTCDFGNNWVSDQFGKLDSILNRDATHIESVVQNKKVRVQFYQNPSVSGYKLH